MYIDQLSNAANVKTFAVIGDTQRTMGYQKLMGREANNHAERTQLLSDIAERKPGFLLALGDLVTYGQFSSDWQYFDAVMAPVRDQQIPVLPVIGNHDYFVFTRHAVPHLHSRFPRLKEATWYVQKVGALALVVVDSNMSSLGQATWNAQLAWLTSAVASLEQDPYVKGIIFCGHHPIQTNSFEVWPHKPSVTHILPHFQQSKKSLLYLSGHCHAYERFTRDGKMLIVSGGGGGPRQALRRGSLQRHPDLYPGATLRPFHYLAFTITEKGVDIEVRGLEKHATELHELERFSLPWNA